MFADIPNDIIVTHIIPNMSANSLINFRNTSQLARKHITVEYILMKPIDIVLAYRENDRNVIMFYLNFIDGTSHTLFTYVKICHNNQYYDSFAFLLRKWWIKYCTEYNDMDRYLSKWLLESYEQNNPHFIAILQQFEIDFGIHVSLDNDVCKYELYKYVDLCNFYFKRKIYVLAFQCHVQYALYNVIVRMSVFDNKNNSNFIINTIRLCYEIYKKECTLYTYTSFRRAIACAIGGCIGASIVDKNNI